MPPLFSEEENLVKDLAKKIADKVLKPNKANWAKQSYFPKAALDAFAESGLMGMFIPETYQGSNASYTAFALALIEIAKGDGGCSTVLSVHNSVASLPILQFGTPEQKTAFLPDLATGKKLGCFCLTEPQAGSDASNIHCTATQKNGQYILNGVKQFVTVGHQAQLAIVIANSNPFPERPINKNLTAFIVPTHTPGFMVGRVEHKMGQSTAPIAQILLENCTIPASYKLGLEGEGYKIALSQLESGRIGIAAQAIGMAEAALEESILYTQQRQSFGKYLYEHQSIRFKLAEMATKLEAGRQLVLYAAKLKDLKLPALKAAAQAKLFATEQAEKIVSDALQLFGGYGYLQDYAIEQIYRDIRATTLYEGTSEIQKILIARELFKT
jgi:alkylation response protein AidB-like acyl-CoA dehydrogenase